MHIIDMHLFYKNCVLPSLPSYELRRGLMMLTLRELCCEQIQMSHSMPAVKALLDVNNFYPLPRDLVGAPMTRGPESRVHLLGKSTLPFFFSKTYQVHYCCYWKFFFLTVSIFIHVNHCCTSLPNNISGRSRIRILLHPAVPSIFVVSFLLTRGLFCSCVVCKKIFRR